ncbi:unnamed protein product [Nippostrongylus brasiliensis]|uniref:Rab3 GTPase-activating protein catalytic subunit n=1 Tax=Nippostrongylus brasiliensis TaxID=27835 RepID=A0A0N4YAE7_NIPBR|nr:unnamed protein product [Nippostrongylus brasiliensis]
MFKEHNLFYVTTALTFEIETLRVLLNFTDPWVSEYNEVAVHLVMALAHLSSAAAKHLMILDETNQLVEELLKLADEEQPKAGMDAIKAAEQVLDQIIKKLPTGAFNMPSDLRNPSLSN